MTLVERWQTVEAVDLYRSMLDRFGHVGLAYDIGDVLSKVADQLSRQQGLVGGPFVYRSLHATMRTQSVSLRLSSRARDTILQLERHFKLASMPGADRRWAAAYGLSSFLTSVRGTPSQLFSVCRKVSPDWKRISTLGKCSVDALEESIAEFREPDRSHSQRVKLLETLDVSLEQLADDPKTRGVVDWVRNSLLVSLLRRSFIWPLVVAGLHEDVGISVPLGITVNYPQPGSTLPHSWPSIEILGVTGHEADEWREAIHRGRVGAYWLWRVRHGYHGAEARRAKRAARVAVDVSQSAALLAPLYAARIIQPWGPDAGDRTSLSSAESYFALQLFGHHVRRPLGTATVVTGSLGSLKDSSDYNFEDSGALAQSRSDQLANTDFRTDFALNRAGAMSAKLEYAARTSVLSRVIAREFAPEDLPSAPEQLGFEMVAVSTLQEVVRAAFGDNTQAQRYARFDEANDLQTAETSRMVWSIVEKLRSNDRATLHVSESLSSIVSAVRFLDQRLRTEESDRQRTPPRFSWVVADLDGIKTADAWSIIWERCDGSPADLESFLRCTNGHERAGCVEALLNRFTDSARLRGLRAPDLLVLKLPMRRVRPDLESSSDIEDILSAAALTRSTDQRLDPFLGYTRVILTRAPAIRQTTVVVPTPTVTDQILRDDLDAIRVFRFGVDVHVLRRFLALVGGDAPGMDTRARVAALLSCGHVAKSGWFIQVERGLRGSTGHLDPLQASIVHASAARALVPVLNLSNGIPTDIDRAHGVQTLVEASWHAFQGTRSLHAAPSVDRGEKTRVQNMLDNIVVTISASLLPPSWESVKTLTAVSPDMAVRVMHQLVSASNIIELPISERFIALAAIWKSRRHPSVIGEEMVVNADVLIHSILRDAEHSRPDNWIDAAHFALGSLEVSDNGWTELSEVVATGLAKIRKRWETPPFFVSHRWAHKWARVEPYHRVAIERYRAMSWWVHTPVQILVEMLGASVISRYNAPSIPDQIDRILEICGDNFEDRIRRVEARSFRRSRRFDETPEHAKERTRAGVATLRRHKR